MSDLSNYLLNDIGEMSMPLYILIMFFVLIGVTYVVMNGIS